MNAGTNKLPHLGRIIDGTNMGSGTVRQKFCRKSSSSTGVTSARLSGEGNQQLMNYLKRSTDDHIC